MCQTCDRSSVSECAQNGLGNTYLSWFSRYGNLSIRAVYYDNKARFYLVFNMKFCPYYTDIGGTIHSCSSLSVLWSAFNAKYTLEIALAVGHCVTHLKLLSDSTGSVSVFLKWTWRCLILTICSHSPSRYMNRMIWVNKWQVWKG